MASAGLLTRAAAAATLPMYGGPGGAATTATGFRSPFQNLAPGVPINNVGTAIGVGNKYNNNVGIGRRALRWTVGGSPTELGGLTNANLNTMGEAFAINNAGVVVGYASKPMSGGQRAVRYDSASATSPTELATLTLNNNGQGESAAVAISNSGIAAGYSSIYQSNVYKGTRAVRWLPGSTSATPLDVINTDSSGIGYATATAINDAGTTVGSGRRTGPGDANLGFRPLRWASNSVTPFELDVINARADGYAYGGTYAINAAGATVGFSKRFAGNNDMGDRPARWNTGGTGISELGVLGTDVNGSTTGYARDLNDAGTATGWVNKYSDAGVDLGFRAVRWDAANNAVVELGTLGDNPAGQNNSLGTSINNLGTISGSSLAFAPGGASTGARATLWLPGTNTPLDLNTVIAADIGWTLTYAYQVTDTGFVTGAATFDSDGAGPQPVQNRLFMMLVPQAGTYGRGDANFDTAVNFADLVLLAQHYNKPSNGSTNVADFDLDGVTNFADLVTLAKNYNTGVPSVAALGNGQLAADWALAQSLVPEPAVLSVASALLAAATRRRR